MKRFYYGNFIENFCFDSRSSILGKLTAAHNFNKLDERQKFAWISQIEILKNQLSGLRGYIFFEFAIPRMGKRVDNIVIIGDTIFIFEFKVGSDKFKNHDIDQAIDYALDLKNFHEGSHVARIIPILISTEVTLSLNTLDFSYMKKTFNPILIGKNQLSSIIEKIDTTKLTIIDPIEWVNSRYKPTPTIIEAAKALYGGHKVAEISRSDAGAINLTKTTDCINKIIDDSKLNNLKSICFITGVPGSGKTLAGLNIAIERHKMDEGEHAVYLSGNGPLVDVLREALARDQSERHRISGEKILKKESYRRANAFIQNIHHFRDDALASSNPPIEKVVVFDEAQRAWTAEKAIDFMKKKRNKPDFDKSEPEFLISVMDRHQESCAIVCLVGGGQEINLGEAGIEEWIKALKNSFPTWKIFYSNLIIEDENYLKDQLLIQWLELHGTSKKDLHLGVSLRSFRSEKLSEFVKKLLEIEISIAIDLLTNIKKAYPIIITRDLSKARAWLKEKAQGTERYGLVASSNAMRLIPSGINIKHKIKPPIWFLNNNDDIRSSYFMEEVATEFDIQGLELDWVCVCWDGDLSYQSGKWEHKKFSGTSWKRRNLQIHRDYLVNAYRVLLTRARQGMIIFVPEGNDEDKTRLSKFYDGTFEYLRSLGIEILT
jgi:hypothetical protein